ncbi:GNAT family N-acetyltransferase [Streptomyces sp. NBC_00820]|uniref:GNAT family N-acetyltransferase n=1 Tax=Streptomyces sp. NBC_00820 TaxID=2975842 RepID=UPI002ED28D12|nr:GNAT family N-acetyltransferase [Streptomyces sp. NBC_00820]
MADLSPLRLPAGYRSRAATTADAPAIHRLVSACERELHGRAVTGADAIAADLASPGVDPASDTVLVDGPRGEPAAWGRLERGRRFRADVHPGHRGRGLGTALLAWAETRARQAGSDRIAQTVPDDDRAAVALLRAGGYLPFVTEWLLEIELPTEPPALRPPAGITVRPFRPGDEQAAYRLTEDAFGAWQRRRLSYEEWAGHCVARETFDPAASPVAFAGDQMVGVVLSLDLPGLDEGYVERVAVRHDHRDRGIARVLLREAFRACHRRGKRTCTLWTHSETGALPLYQRLGMTVRRSSTVYGRALTVVRPA